MASSACLCSSILQLEVGVVAQCSACTPSGHPPLLDALHVMAALCMVFDSKPTSHIGKQRFVDKQRSEQLRSWCSCSIETQSFSKCDTDSR